MIDIKLIDEMRNRKNKPKELVAYLTKSIAEDGKLYSQLVQILKSGSDVEKGTAADVMKHVSKGNPEIVVPYIEDMIGYINYKTPRVKWGVPEAIGNIAKKYPTKVEKAVPYLLLNTEDKSTVVRWCAAYALAEIIKSNPKIRKELVPKIEETLESEKNNGVRNIYLKALKTIGK